MISTVKPEEDRIVPAPQRDPTNGTFELTVRCNLHCKMCLFRHDDAENAEIMKKELTAAEWIDMARQAAEAGTFNLLITGGEPLLRPDFCEIWEGIYQYGFLITLYTNATLVTPKIMETLRKYPPHKIDVTIYGASPETYEKVCGNANAFERMMNGVRQLQLLPSVMGFRTTLIRDNKDDGEKIDQLLLEEFSYPSGANRASPINLAVRGACADVAACRIPPEEDAAMKAEAIESSLRQTIDSCLGNGTLVIHRDNLGTNGPSSGEPTRYSFFGCQAGVSQYTVTYDGKLLACQMLGAFSTDAKEEGLQKAWERFPSVIRYSDSPAKCGSCAYWKSCQSCYGTRYAETGDLNGCSDYLFSEARARNRYAVLAGGEVKFESGT